MYITKQGANMSIDGIREMYEKSPPENMQILHETVSYRFGLDPKTSEILIYVIDGNPMVGRINIMGLNGLEAAIKLAEQQVSP